jgi:hypothetical protein
MFMQGNKKEFLNMIQINSTIYDFDDGLTLTDTVPLF